jgi:hypothetical protein
VLLNSTKNNTAEKDAKPNHTLDAFDVIDAIKEKLEKKCPRTVSCADILAIAARDAVSLVRNQAEFRFLNHGMRRFRTYESWLSWV